MTKPAQNEKKARSFGENLESDLSPRFLRVVEVAAIDSARTMGQGERKHADKVATEAMRRTMDSIPMREELSSAKASGMRHRCCISVSRLGQSSRLDLKSLTSILPLTPLRELTCALPVCRERSLFLAAAERDGLLHAPDCYMEKIVVGPSCKNAVDLNATPAENLKNIAQRLNRDVEDLVVIVLDRPRHEKLITDIRKAGARIRLIGDGDLSARHCSGCSGNRRARGYGFRRRT